MNDFTKSSALVSSTSSISSRIASMSSSSCSLRSATADSGATVSSSTGASSVDFFGCFCSCAMSSTLSTRRMKNVSARQCTEELLCRVASVDELADVRLGPSQRVHGGDTLQRFTARAVEDHRVPRRSGDRVGILLQAAPPEVGTGVLGRVVHGVLGVLRVEKGLDLPQPDKAVVELLLRTDVGILQVDQVQLGVVPTHQIGRAHV